MVLWIPNTWRMLCPDEFVSALQTAVYNSYYFALFNDTGPFYLPFSSAILNQKFLSLNRV